MLKKQSATTTSEDIVSVPKRYCSSRKELLPGLGTRASSAYRPQDTKRVTAATSPYLRSATAYLAQTYKPCQRGAAVH
jgi:hypothetical protein